MSILSLTGPHVKNNFHFFLRFLNMSRLTFIIKKYIIITCVNYSNLRLRKSARKGMYRGDKKIFQKWQRICLRTLRKKGRAVGLYLPKSLSFLSLVSSRRYKSRRQGVRMSRRDGAYKSAYRRQKGLYNRTQVYQMRRNTQQPRSQWSENSAGWHFSADKTQRKWNFLNKYLTLHWNRTEKVRR